MKNHKNRRVNVSQNVAWTSQRGSWMIQVIVVLFLKLTLSILFDGDVAWQLSLIVYNITTFIFFHLIPGDPFSNRYGVYTFWEQLSEQLEDSSGPVFITLFPLMMFIIINFVVKWNAFLFWTCVVTLFLVIVPKLGFMHLRRILFFKE